MSQSFFTGLLKHGSLEVGLGAVMMSAALASTHGIRIPPVVYLALFCSVWFIYLLDRLFDAKKIKAPAANPRHLFYQQNHTTLCLLLVLAGLTGLCTIPFLPVPVLIFGIVLMGLCLLYLLWVYLSDKQLPKEVLIATLYTIGVLLAPGQLQSNSEEAISWLIFPAIFLIAFINLLLFSKLEEQYDCADKQASIVTGWSQVKLKNTLNLIFVAEGFLIFMLGVYSSSDNIVWLQLLLLLMTAILWILYKRVDNFTNPAIFRWIGDGIFLLPVLLLLL